MAHSKFSARYAWNPNMARVPISLSPAAALTVNAITMLVIGSTGSSTRQGIDGDPVGLSVCMARRRCSICAASASRCIALSKSR